MKIKTLFKCLGGLAICSSLIPVGMSFNNKAISLSISLSNQNIGNLEQSNEIIWDIDNNGLIGPHDKSQVGESVIIPTKVGEKVVKGLRGGSFGVGAFWGCKNLQSVTFEENTSFTTIGIEAFYGCTSLVSVTLPSTITSIGDRAFWDCPLKTINFENNDHYVWKGDSTNGYLIAKNQTDQYACPTCLAIGSIDLTGATVINTKAFGHCTDITRINIPDTVTSIGEYAFNECTGLTIINIPGSVTSIGDGAFASCTSLTSVILSNGLNLISTGAFAYCASITTLNIPATVNNLSIGCFSNCYNLKNINTFWTTEEVNNLYRLRATFAGIESLTINYFVNENDDDNKLLETYKAKFTLERTAAKHIEFRRANPSINIGAILGGIFGSIAAIGLISSGIVLYKKKHNNKENKNK